MAIPELALKHKAIITIIKILFSGQNQFATNLDALINLKGNPIKDDNQPKKKNQNETFINIALTDPTKVRIHPNQLIIIPIIILYLIPYFSLIILPGMIIITENTVKLIVKNYKYLLFYI